MPEPRMTGAGTLLVALVVAAVPAAGQEAAAPPSFPFGTPVAVMPVQSVLPLPGGGWPGPAAGEEETLRGADAELAFALADRRGAAAWATAEDVVRRVERNPLLRVDPKRLAFQGLLQPLEGQIYEPLHGQLRSLAALFDTRFVVLPVALYAEPTEAAAPDVAATSGGGEGPGDGAGRVPEREGAPGAEIRPADPPTEAGPATTRWRAVLRLALIDVRRSQVLWHGEVRGDPSAADSPALLATLAQRVAREIAPS